MKCLVTGKKVLTRREAVRQASWWRRARFARMSHYRCDQCGGFHIGNERGRKPGRVKR